MNDPAIPLELITERARVLRVAHDVVWVRCESQAGCARCAAGQGCGGGLFARLLRGRLQELPVALPPEFSARIAVGDTVLIGLSVAAVQNASLLLYGVPLAGLLVGAVVGQVGGNDAFALAGAAAGLLAGLSLARVLAARSARHGGLEPVLLRTLASGEACPGPRQHGQ